MTGHRGSVPQNLLRAFLAIFVSLCCFMLFSFLVLESAENRYLDFDSAYHASVSKNLANGYGYATSYHEKIWLNPDITTGSTLIAPFASYLGIAENDIQSPLRFAACLNLALIAVLLLLLCFQLKKPLDFFLFALGFQLFLLLWEPKWLTAFTADMPVILFLALLTALLTLEQTRYFRATSLFLGVFAALDEKKKMTALIGFVVLFPALVFQLYRLSVRQGKEGGFIALIFVAGGFFIAFMPLKTIEGHALAN
ncbi:MAG: hypothetical protein KDI30_06670, partial [Pseudomonadales bacterium]|nr:hypothetical protein [Pseudomonadales bacterium]